jgi:hypothetical protein
VVLVLGGLAACSDEPSGPGEVDVVVEAAVPLGAAVVELIGGPVDGVEQPAAGWTSLARTGPDRYRLVVIAEEPGTLVAAIRVPDVGGPLPTASVVDATGAQDARVGGAANARVRR